MTKEDKNTENKLLKFRSVVQAALTESLATLPAPLTEEILGQLESAPELEPSRGTLHRFIADLFFQAGFLFGQIRYNDHTVFQTGAPDFSRQEHTTANPMGMDLDAHDLTRVLEQDFRGNGSRIEIEGVAPRKIKRLARKLLRLEILPIVSMHFHDYPVLEDRRVRNLVRPIENEIQRQMEKLEEQGKAEMGIVLTHFKFQGMDRYFEFLGEFYSMDIMKTIHQTLSRNLKVGDTVLFLSSRSFLGISPGADPEAILRRFRSIYIQVSGLVLDYELLQTRVVGEFDPVKIWKELEI